MASNAELVLGIEADIQASGEEAQGNPHHSLFSFTETPITVTAGQTATHNDNLLWFGTVRGRIGYAAWPTVMVYGTGGLAYGRFNDSVSSIFTATTTQNGGGGSTVNSPTFDASTTKMGWTVGGGIEGAVPSTHVTWKAEYLYMDLVQRNYTFNDPFFQSDDQEPFHRPHLPRRSQLALKLKRSLKLDNILRVGPNYQFH